jgi:hypothetical protein
LSFCLRSTHTLSHAASDPPPQDSRKGIHKERWENERLDLEEEVLVQKMKELQLLRVTKELQTLLKVWGGGFETKGANWRGCELKPSARRGWQGGAGGCDVRAAAGV